MPPPPPPLLQLIIKDKVKYPKGMSRSFKDFLAGLLVKNPERRMTWPDLARHPFVCEEGDLTEDGQACMFSAERGGSGRNDADTCTVTLKAITVPPPGSCQKPSGVFNSTFTLLAA